MSSNEHVCRGCGYILPQRVDGTAPSSFEVDRLCSNCAFTVVRWKTGKGTFSALPWWSTIPTSTFDDSRWLVLIDEWLEAGKPSEPAGPVEQIEVDISQPGFPPTEI